ncbi:MAG: PIN domain nuclease [Actinomycetota bacterium]
MKQLRLYFDTSIFNFALADDVPIEKAVTLKLLEEVAKGKYEVYISDVVIREINRAPQKKAINLARLINKLGAVEISIEEASFSLARKYVDAGIIPARYEDDALHIAIASVNNLDCYCKLELCTYCQVKD